MSHVSKVNRSISLRILAGATVLSGTQRGQETLSKLLREVSAEPSTPEPIFLDFTGIEVATASFLRESVLAFRDIVRGRRSTYYPVIANANDAVRDELIELVKPRGEVLMACKLATGGSVFDPVLIGDLDPKQRLTFDLVIERGETDAGELMRDFGSREGVRATAWNNRLSSLVSRGLIIEVSYGRAKRYRPLFAGV
jgi:uncharacterized protein (DUF58 family)